MVEIEVECTYEGLNGCQFYNGHGHVHEKNLLACCHFAVPARPMTYRELADEIIQEVHARWFVEESEGAGDLTDNLITDSMIESAIWQELGEYPDVMVYGTDEYPTESDHWEEMYLYGYIHIYILP